MRGLPLAALLIICCSAFASPESDYMIHCMGCHLADGQGMPPDVPSFDSRLTQLSATHEGRAYLVQVPGAAQAPISDAELADVLNWILASYTDTRFTAFSADEVAGYRSEIMKDPNAGRAALFQE